MLATSICGCTEWKLVTEDMEFSYESRSIEYTEKVGLSREIL
jgi:hypothetical protein